MPELFKLPVGAPEIFAKFRNTLVPHGGQVRLNPRSKKHDYEAEIAVIIGRRASCVPENEAMDYVFGYTLANDITDLQDGETSVFLRLGSDYKSNFYEYEVPLTLTPEGNYDTYSAAGCRALCGREA